MAGRDEPDSRELGPLALCALAIGVGLAAGLGAVAFRGLIAFFHSLFLLGRLSLACDGEDEDDS